MIKSNISLIHMQTVVSSNHSTLSSANTCSMCIIYYFSRWILLLLSVQECLKGTNGYTLLPPKIAHVCPGEPLMLTCVTEGVLVEWNISIVQYGYIGGRFVSHIGGPNIDPLSVNSITFNFVRNSTEPLMVTLIISSVIVDLQVSCKQYNQSGVSSDVFATAVQVMTANDTSDLRPPDIRIIDHSFGKHNVTILLERTMFMQEETYHGIAYVATINVVPYVAIIVHNATHYEFSLSYNVVYNVTAFARMCAQSSEMITIRQFYAQCESLVQGTNIDASVIFVNYTDPSLEGATVNLSCAPELVLAGPVSATCMRNGKWEPDPTDVMCKVDCGVPTTNINVSLSYSSTLENSHLSFWCRHGLVPDEIFIATCHRNASWSPTPTQHFYTTALSANCGIPTPIINGHVLPYTSTVEGAMITIICHDIQLVSPLIENSTTVVCNHGGQWEPNPFDVCIKIPEADTPLPSASSLSRQAVIAIVSSVAVFLLNSMLFFAIGLSCMRLCWSKKSEKTTTAATTENNEPVPVYESLTFDISHVGHQKQDFNLKENIAYSYVHCQHKKLMIRDRN